MAQADHVTERGFDHRGAHRTECLARGAFRHRRVHFGSDGGAAACERFGRCRSKGHARAHLFSLVHQPCLAERAQLDSKGHRILLKDTRIVITVKV